MKGRYKFVTSKTESQRFSAGLQKKDDSIFKKVIKHGKSIINLQQEEEKETN